MTLSHTVAKPLAEINQTNVTLAITSSIQANHPGATVTVTFASIPAASVYKSTSTTDVTTSVSGEIEPDHTGYPSGHELRTSKNSTSAGVLDSLTISTGAVTTPRNLTFTVAACETSGCDVSSGQAGVQVTELPDADKLVLDGQTDTWSIASDQLTRGCAIRTDRPCISDGSSDSETYGDNMLCTFTAMKDMFVSATRFAVEDVHDNLNVNGKYYWGSDGPVRVPLSQGDRVIFSTDTTGRDDGFELCAVAATSDDDGGLSTAAIAGIAAGGAIAVGVAGYVAYTKLIATGGKHTRSRVPF